MKGYLTSYAGLFAGQRGEAPAVRDIEIPLIQRDYAQGRPDPRASDIRDAFLDVLLDAVAGGGPVGLDFVYGRVSDGVFRPLDGQQRLTTLFLLHWYLAAAAGKLEAGASWTRFSYATRASARLFCRRLVINPLSLETDVPSQWIVDQGWYLHVWRNDPTVQAMLVVIDAIHKEVRRRDLDVKQAWNRLTSVDSPAVSFYLLPLADMHSDEDLYIKMNSRGKPLTAFENFKARFEQDLQHSDRAEEFAHKVDGAWSDLLWPFHGGDNIVDDEFMRYLSVIVRLCEWREGRRTSESRLDRRARTVFGEDNSNAEGHLDFLFGAFDVWRDVEHIESTFHDVLSTTRPGAPGYDPVKVVFFGGGGVNLFEQGLRHGTGAQFTAQHLLLLHAFLLHLIEETVDFPRRVRILRNLIAASDNEIRPLAMSVLVQDVEAVARDGDLNALRGFNSSQIDDEKLKAAFLEENPECAEALFRLEDHNLLRGNLSSFEFDGDTFIHRAEAFEAAFRDPSLWQPLKGALLATGDYQRQRPNKRAWYFGASSDDQAPMWRDLLTGTTRSRLSETRAVLGRFLDSFPLDDTDIAGHLDTIMHDWLAEREAALRLDWRYYIVKYPSMRAGATGIYYGTAGRLGYSLCMLNKSQLNSYYRDPVLLEIWRYSGVGASVRDPWFTSDESKPRWLHLEASGTGMRIVEDGFELRGPEDETLQAAFDAVCARHESVQATNGRILLAIPQADQGQGPIDTADRVPIGARFLCDLVQAGL